ncbi:MAG: hypothetical protein QM523_02510 [Candidatus Pacebacteria bacterium]|nr:hypothetical protein [Candidatus Paceibacterota bacterium]
MDKICPKCRTSYPANASICALDGNLLVFATAAEPIPAAAVEGDQITQGAESPIAATEPHLVQNLLGDDPLPHRPAPAAGESTKTEQPGEARPSKIQSKRTKSGAEVSHKLSQLMTAEAIDEILPKTLVVAGWQLTSPEAIVHRDAYSQWSVVKNSGETAIYTRFLPRGVVTPNGIYDRLVNQLHSGIALLYGYGVASHSSTEFPYEISKLPLQRQLLDQWLQINQGEKAAELLLHHLVKLIQNLADLDLRAIVFNPNFISIAADGLTLDIDAALFYRSREFAYNNAASHLVIEPWAAPEIKERRNIVLGSDIFSAAQIVAYAFFGRQIEYFQIRNSEIPFKEIHNQKIQRFLMGCLYPDPRFRWTIEDVITDLDEVERGQPPSTDLPNWDNLIAGSAKSSFTMGSKSYHDAKELMRSLVEPGNWDQALVQFNELLNWIETTPFRPQVSQVKAAIHRSDNWKLVMLAQLINPADPPFWREYSLADENIESTLTQLGIDASNGNKQAQRLLQELYSADLRADSSINGLG